MLTSRSKLVRCSLVSFALLGGVAHAQERGGGKVEPRKPADYTPPSTPSSGATPAPPSAVPSSAPSAAGSEPTKSGCQVAAVGPVGGTLLPVGLGLLLVCARRRRH